MRYPRVLRLLFLGLVTEQPGTLNRAHGLTTKPRPEVTVALAQCRKKRLNFMH